MTEIKAGFLRAFRMTQMIGRRRVLGQALGLGAAALAMGFGRPDKALADVAPRSASLLNLHTGERFTGVYFENGRYVADALAEGMRVLRDWRTGEEHVIEPELFDILHGVRTRLETNRPFQVISGYRSPRTNAALHAKSSGVASNSQHTLGKAVDVRLDGVELRHVRKAALDLGAGGVGYYPQSNFVHVDTGRVRQWAGA